MQLRKNVMGRKTAKELITSLTCINATGLHKSTPFVTKIHEVLRTLIVQDIANTHSLHRLQLEFFRNGSTVNLLHYDSRWKTRGTILKITYPWQHFVKNC